MEGARTEGGGTGGGDGGDARGRRDADCERRARARAGEEDEQRAQHREGPALSLQLVRAPAGQGGPSSRPHLELFNPPVRFRFRSCNDGVSFVRLVSCECESGIAGPAWPAVV